MRWLLAKLNEQRRSGSISAGVYAFYLSNFRRRAAAGLAPASFDKVKDMKEAQVLIDELHGLEEASQRASGLNESEYQEIIQKNKELLREIRSLEAFIDYYKRANAYRERMRKLESQLNAVEERRREPGLNVFNLSWWRSVRRLRDQRSALKAERKLLCQIDESEYSPEWLEEIRAQKNLYLIESNAKISEAFKTARQKLSEEFKHRSNTEAIEYRDELLRSVQNRFELQSVVEAAGFVRELIDNDEPLDDEDFELFDLFDGEGD